MNFLTVHDDLVICLARPKAVSQAKPGLFGPGQARPLVTAQQWLWQGPEMLKAKAAGLSRGFGHVIKRRDFFLKNVNK